MKEAPKKIRRYLRQHPRRVSLPHVRYTAYQFTSARIRLADGREVPLTGFTLQSAPMEETQAGIAVPALQSFSISFKTPHAASHLFSRPESDPRNN